MRRGHLRPHIARLTVDLDPSSCQPSLEGLRIISSTAAQRWRPAFYVASRSNMRYRRSLSVSRGWASYRFLASRERCVRRRSHCLPSSTHCSTPDGSGSQAGLALRNCHRFALDDVQDQGCICDLAGVQRLISPPSIMVLIVTFPSTLTPEQEEEFRCVQYSCTALGELGASKKPRHD